MYLFIYFLGFNLFPIPLESYLVFLLLGFYFFHLVFIQFDLFTYVYLVRFVL